MTAIAVTGVGVVAPIGVGVEACFAALEHGTCANAPAVAAPPKTWLGLAARVGEFGARQKISPVAIRRMPRLTQLALVAAREALDGAKPLEHYDAARAGIVTGTGLGTIEDTLTFTRGYLEGGPEAASPTLFPISVMNAVAGQLAVDCGLKGPNSTVNHRDHSALGAVAFACDLLALGRADALLVAAFDELSPPAEHGYLKLGGVSSSALRPYDVERDGLVPGEGAAAIVLERADDAKKRGARIRAIIPADGRSETGGHRPRVGWGRAPAWPEAARAVAEAVAIRGANEIDLVLGGGNGTALDERELGALAEGLGRRPPVASILGQTGEFFTSGLLRLVAALFALEHQLAPGTVGLRRAPDAWRDAIIATPRAQSIDAVLLPSFSQGGANCALVVARA